MTKNTFHEDTATKDQPGRHREHEDGESSPLDLLLTPQCRITVLQSALDSLTLQIAHKKHLFNPGEKRVRLLQDQVRLIGSQIRSYEKLEQLKKDMGLAGTSLVAEEVARENMHAVEPVDAAVATGPEKNLPRRLNHPRSSMRRSGQLVSRKKIPTWVGLTPPP